MSLSLIEVRVAADAPGKYCEFRIAADAPLPATCLIAIERPGQDKAFLAADGWQSNYVRLATPVCHDEPDASCLRLSGTLLRFLETGYNYRLTLFDPHGTELGMFVVNWYPPPSFLSPAPPPHRPSAVATDATAEELRPVPADQDDEPPNVSAGFRPPFPDSPSHHQPTRQVTRCAQCKGEVFSTFATCPYCGHVLR